MNKKRVFKKAEMIITDAYSITSSKYSVTVTKLFDSEDKQGNPIKSKCYYYFGTLYQALLFILNDAPKEASSLDDAFSKIKLLMETINFKEEEIKQKFRTEVLLSSPN